MYVYLKDTRIRNENALKVYREKKQIFHRFISGNEAHRDETKIRQEDRESVQRKRIEAQKTQKHTVKQSRHKKHTYILTNRSDFLIYQAMCSKCNVTFRLHHMHCNRCCTFWGMYVCR